MKQNKEKYQELLLNDRWHEKRAKVFERDGYKCQHCGINRNLNCHHTYYVSGKKPWEYPLSSLLTLCRECHTRLHSISKVQTRPPKSNQKKFRENKDKRKVRKLYASLSERDRTIQSRYDALR